MAVDESGCFWWHSIELPDGTLTPGEKTPAIQDQEWEECALPDLVGKSVLDIGAWDGWFSFRAERAGAARVVAMDSFVWSLDFSRGEEYAAHTAACRAAGIAPQPWGPGCDWWDDKALLGKRGFDRARAALGSRVEDAVLDFSTDDLSELGAFDVVLFLGVLYHLEEPLTAAHRLRALTRELAVVETAAIDLVGQEQRPLLELTPGAEVNADTTNWFFPNEAGAHALLLAGGFSSVETVARSFENEARPGVKDYRLTLHARP